MERFNRIVCGLIVLALTACGEPAPGPMMGELHSGENLIHLVYDSPPGPVRQPIYLTLKVPRSYISGYRQGGRSPELEMEMFLPSANADLKTISARELMSWRDDAGEFRWQDKDGYRLRRINIELSSKAAAVISPYGFLQTYTAVVKSIKDMYLITGEHQYDLEKYLWGGCGRELPNSRPLKEVLENHDECYVSTNSFWLSPELDGRSVFIKCASQANCMADLRHPLIFHSKQIQTFPAMSVAHATFPRIFALAG